MGQTVQFCSEPLERFLLHSGMVLEATAPWKTILPRS